jgi:hypothetical protein
MKVYIPSTLKARHVLLRHSFATLLFCVIIFPRCFFVSFFYHVVVFLSFFHHVVFSDDNLEHICCFLTRIMPVSFSLFDCWHKTRASSIVKMIKEKFWMFCYHFDCTPSHSKRYLYVYKACQRISDAYREGVFILESNHQAGI